MSPLERDARKMLDLFWTVWTILSQFTSKSGSMIRQIKRKCSTAYPRSSSSIRSLLMRTWLVHPRAEFNAWIKPSTIWISRGIICLSTSSRDRNSLWPKLITITWLQCSELLQDGRRCFTAASKLYSTLNLAEQTRWLVNLRIMWTNWRLGQTILGKHWYKPRFTI